MAYPEDVKKKILIKIENGEKIKDISEETGISKPTLYKWAKEVEKQTENIKKVKRNYDRPSMDEIITSKEIKRLIKLKKIDEAIKLTDKYLSNPVIQSQKMKILIKKRQFQEAKKIGERFKDYVPIQSQMITIAIEEGKIGEAKKIGGRFKTDASIQSQIVTIAIKEGKIEEAKKIGERFKDNAPIQSQMITIEEKIEENKKIEELFKEDTQQVVKNRIKSQIYWDKITDETIDEINTNKDLTEYEKTIMLLAICEKKQFHSRIKQIISSNKEKFTQKQQKVLSQILNKSESKRKMFFDMGFYDEILKWDFDKRLNQQYMQEEENKKIEKEETKKEEVRKRRIEEVAKKEEIGKLKEEKNRREKIRKREKEETKKEEIRELKEEKEKGKLKKEQIEEKEKKKDVKNEKISYILKYFDKLKSKIYCEMQSTNYLKQREAIKKWDKIENMIERIKNKPNDIHIEDLYAKIKLITEQDLER